MSHDEGSSGGVLCWWVTGFAWIYFLYIIWMYVGRLSHVHMSLSFPLQTGYQAPPNTMMESAFRGSHLGCGQGIGLITDEVGLFEVQACWVPSPTIEIRMTGNLSSTSKEAFMWMVGFVEDHSATFGTLLGHPPGQAKQLSLYRPGCQLHIHMSHEYEPIKKAYQMGAIWVCLVSLLVGKPSRPDVMVFGDVDDSGYFLSSWRCTRQMVECGLMLGMRRMVMSGHTVIDDDARALAELPHPQEHGKVRMEMVNVRRVTDMVPYCFDV